MPPPTGPETPSTGSATSSSSSRSRGTTRDPRSVRRRDAPMARRDAQARLAPPRQSGRVAKELNECAPVIDQCLRFLDERVPVPPADPAERVNVLDLCSGFGYLGMFLSECLDPERCQRIDPSGQAVADARGPARGAAAPDQLGPRVRVRGEEGGDFLRPEVFEDPERVTRRFDATEYYAARGTISVLPRATDATDATTTGTTTKTTTPRRRRLLSFLTSGGLGGPSPSRRVRWT